MTTSTTRGSFWLGIKDGLPFLLLIGPFALLFGVVATEAGLDVMAALGFSVVIIAGAAQFTAVSLLADNAPVWIVLITSLAVNLRMAMYSAGLTPYLGKAPLWQRALVAYGMVDQAYALSIARYEANPEWTVSQRVFYFLGVVALVSPFWFILTVVGAVAGTAIPESWALDFALPITFMAMFAPMLRTVAYLATAATSVVLSLLFMGLPSGVGLMLAAIIAMMVGAFIETRMEAPND